MVLLAPRTWVAKRLLPPGRGSFGRFVEEAIMGGIGAAAELSPPIRLAEYHGTFSTRFTMMYTSMFGRLWTLINSSLYGDDCRTASFSSL